MMRYDVKNIDGKQFIEGPLQRYGSIGRKVKKNKQVRVTNMQIDSYIDTNFVRKKT